MLAGEPLAKRCALAASDRKALSVVIVDLRGRNAITDFLVIASGTSDRHVQAIAEGVERDLRTDHGTRTVGTEGIREGLWALVDFGDVVVHVFHQFTRQVYALETMWQDAPRITAEGTLGGT